MLYNGAQLREEFDTGREVELGPDHNPHDVGALLKEYFRDLPDPLLTRDLYSAFVATRSKSNPPDPLLTRDLYSAFVATRSKSETCPPLLPMLGSFHH